MAARASFLMVLLVVGVAALALIVTLAVVLRRRANKPVGGPVCGGCGYQLAPNPAGLTVCPECGKDFLSVGILTPELQRRRQGSPVAALGVAWFILVGLGMVPLHGELVKAFTRMVATGTATVTSNGSGPISGIKAAARREQIDGERTPQSLEIEVTVTSGDGKDVEFTIDGKAQKIVKAPKGSGLEGAAWDFEAARKMVAAVASEEDAAAGVPERLKSIVDDAKQKSAGGGAFGTTAFSQTSSMSGFTTAGRSRRYAEFGSSSTYGGSRSPQVFVGPLRGAHWVVVMSIALGLLLAFGGLWIIIALMRGRRHG
ncbi:MAG TPA: hypothetical protein VEB22_09275 [Phycisphaerales bacterium]|nr:hypothetical protein [Phycisphaerales bacterium]